MRKAPKNEQMEDLGINRTIIVITETIERHAQTCPLQKCCLVLFLFPDLLRHFCWFTFGGVLWGTLKDLSYLALRLAGWDFLQAPQPFPMLERTPAPFLPHEGIPWILLQREFHVPWAIDFSKF